MTFRPIDIQFGEREAMPPTHRRTKRQHVFVLPGSNCFIQRFTLHITDEVRGHVSLVVDLETIEGPDARTNV